MMKHLWWAILPFMAVAFCACGEDEPMGDNGDNTMNNGGNTGNTGNNTGSGDGVGSEFDIFASLSYDDMVYVEGGTFLMGAQTSSSSSANYDCDAYSDESPVHSVTLSSYYIGKYEVTQGLWDAVMGKNPSRIKGANLPVENVSWKDCQKFIKKLNALTGITFRLPTEAEWEYAARGGNKSKGYKYSGSNTIDDVAWYCNNSSFATHQVGTKQANELCIYDMSGNVWEWCSDRYGSYSSTSQTDPIGPTSGSWRVVRGGSWYDSARECRVSERCFNAPSLRSGDRGFRLRYKQ